MSDDDEVIELRALQERAYGRSGTLSAAEAARLRELSHRRVARASVSDPAEDPAADVAPDTAEPAAEVSPSSAAPDGAEESASEPASQGVAPRADPARRRWRGLLVGVAAALAVGVGLGWFLFGRPPELVALTPAQQEWQSAIIADAEYDQGSLRPVAVEAGAVLWVATKQEGELICLVLGDGAHTSQECDASEAVQKNGLYGSLVIERGEGQTEVAAQMMLTAGGLPAAITSSYEYNPEATGTSTTTTYASPEEERYADALVAQGYDPRTVWVVGYDDEIPIWTGIRPEESTQCLIYGSDPATAAVGCSENLSDEGLWVESVDPVTAETTRVDWQWSTNYGASLLITRGGGAGLYGEQ